MTTSFDSTLDITLTDKLAGRPRLGAGRNSCADVCNIGSHPDNFDGIATQRRKSA